MITVALVFNPTHSKDKRKYFILFFTTLQRDCNLVHESKTMDDNQTNEHSAAINVSVS
jgi:hypothetical protein